MKLLNWLYSDESLDVKPEDNEPSARKIANVDKASSIIYSALVGGCLDYRAGLNLLGIISSRATGTAMNMVTGGYYGKWRETVYRSTGTTGKAFG